MFGVVQTPGPGTYAVINTNTYKYQLPQYTMKSRTTLPTDATCKPGPGAHHTELVSIII